MSKTNPNIEVTLLSKEDILQSKVFQKVSIGCDQPYWTSIIQTYFIGMVYYRRFYVVDFSDAFATRDSYTTANGVRPVLKFDNLDELIKNCKIEIKDGIQIVEYGEYPHVFEETEIYNSSHLRKTGKIYTLPLLTEFSQHYSLVNLIEYDYDGQKVIEINQKYHPVKPIKFYVDRENSMLISTNVLFKSPIDVDTQKNIYDFKVSYLYNFLNNEFIKDLLLNEKTKYLYYYLNLIECIEKLIRINEAISRKLEELKTTVQGWQYVKKIK